jgi:hypothetical protein
MRRLLVAISLALGALMCLPAGPVGAAPACRFVLGFATLADALPAVGACLDDQQFAANGNAIQHTTGGLLVWRKADNWTAFTDGYRTWINGPSGIQQRLNTQRFVWEAQAEGADSDWTAFTIVPNDGSGTLPSCLPTLSNAIPYTFVQVDLNRYVHRCVAMRAAFPSGDVALAPVPPAVILAIRPDAPQVTLYYPLGQAVVREVVDLSNIPGSQSVALQLRQATVAHPATIAGVMGYGDDLQSLVVLRAVRVVLP